MFNRDGRSRGFGFVLYISQVCPPHLGKVTPVILHGVVVCGRVTPVILHGVEVCGKVTPVILHRVVSPDRSSVAPYFCRPRLLSQSIWAHQFGENGLVFRLGLQKRSKWQMPC